MELLNHTAIANIPIARPPHVLEAESFRAGLRTLYETLQVNQKDDEEIAAFYETGKETIRVHSIQIQANCVLILVGTDEVGNSLAVAGHFSSVNLIYRKIKLGPEKKRIPIGFSISGE